ncbi:MAG: hypothetical protein CNLJKLNK_00903 [Holosporales bacterium]
MKHTDFLKQLFYSQDYLKDIKRPLTTKEIPAFHHWLDEILFYIGDKASPNLTIQKPLFILSALYMSTPENKKVVQDYFEKYPFFMRKILNVSYALMGTLEKDTLCNMVFSLGILSVRPGREWINRFEEDTLYVMHDFNPIHFKKSITGYAHITDIYNKAWIDKWYKLSLDHIDKLQPSDIGLICEALSKIDKACNKDWILYWENYTRIQAKKTNLKQLSSFIKFYATFNFYSQDWVDTMIDESIRKLETENDFEIVARFFNSLGVLGDFSNRQIINLTLDKIYALKDQWRIKDIGIFLYGCALLHVDLKEDHEPLLNALQVFFEHHPRHVSVPLHATYGLMIANKYYNLVHATDFHINLDQTQEMEDYIRKCTTPSPSQTQEQIYSMFKDYHNMEQEVWIPEILTYADLVKVDDRTIIEIDGEHHFQNGHLNSKSTLKTIILKESGYDVVRIPVKL